VSSPANLLKWEKSIFLGFYLFWAVSDFARYRLGQRAKKRETSHVSASGKSHDKSAFHNPRHHLMWGVVDLLMAVVVATFLFFGWSQGGSHAYFTGKDLAIFLTLLAWVGIYFYKYQAILNNEDKYVDNYTDYLQKTKEKGEKDELGHFKLMPWADKDRDTVRPLTENLPDEVRILDYGAGNGKRLKIFLDLLPTDKQYVLRGYDIRDWKDKWEKMFKDSGHNAKWLESDQAIDFHNYHIIFASNIFYQSEIRQNIITKFLQAADPARLLVVRGFDRGTMFHNAALASGLYDQYAWEAKTLELCEQSGLVCMARLPVAQRFLFHQLSGSPSYRMQCTVQMIEGVVCKSLNQHAGVALECMVARERGRCDGRPWQNVDMAGVTLPTDELYLFFGRPANESEARN
jgi:hypothetical protein